MDLSLFAFPTDHAALWLLNHRFAELAQENGCRFVVQPQVATTFWMRWRFDVTGTKSAGYFLAGGR
jgi:hypothetical protein